MVLSTNPASAQSYAVLNPALPSSNWGANVWGPLDGPSYTSPWVNGDIAVFGYGGAQTVTVNSPVSAHGIFLLSDNTNVAGPAAITLTGAGSFIYNQYGSNVGISAPLTGSSGLVVSGNASTGGRTTLSGLNTYTGGTWVGNGGTLIAGRSTSGGNGAFGSVNNSLSLFDETTADLNGFAVGIGSLAENGTVTNSAGSLSVLTIGNGNASTTAFTGTITGNVALNKVGTGTVVLQTANTYSGGTTLNGGVIEVGNDAALGTGNLRFASGPASELRLTNSARPFIDNITVDGGTTATFSAQTGTTAALLFQTMTLGSNAQVVFGSAGNTGVVEFSDVDSGVHGMGFQNADLTVAFGTLRSLDNTAGLFTSFFRSVTINSGATIDLNGQTGIFGNLMGSGNLLMGAGPQPVVLNNANFSGVISGSRRLFIGNATLSGTNTYTGGTFLNNNGTLRVQSNGALGTGPLEIFANSTFDVENGVTIANNLVVNGDFTLAGDGSGAQVTLSGAVALGSATRTITLGGETEAVNASLTGVISGNGGLTIVGAGDSRITIGGNSGNTFTGLLTVGADADVRLNKTSGFAAPGGATVLDTGLLTLSGVNSQVAGTVTVNNGGTLQMFGSQTIDNLQGSGLVINGGSLTVLEGNFSGALNNGGGGSQLIKAGDGTLLLSGTSDRNGQNVLTGGNLMLGNVGAIGSGELVVTGGTLTVVDGNQTFGNRIVVAGNFGIGTVQDGMATTTRISSDVILGAGNYTVTLGVGASLAHSTIFSGSISGPGGLTLTGALSTQQVTFSGTAGNTFGGPLRAGAGILVYMDKSAGFAAPGGLILQNGSRGYLRGESQQVGGLVQIESGANLEVITAQTIDRLEGGGEVNLFDSPLTIHEGNFGGNIISIGGSAPVIKSGSGILVLTGNNTYTGGTFINGGTLAVNSDAALGAAGTRLTVSDSTFGMLGSFNSPRPITVNGYGGFETDPEVAVTLSGVISGNGTLVKTGAGTLTLLGANTYTQGTSIEGGVLEISSDGNLGAAAGEISFYGGTLRLLGNWNSARDGVIGTDGATIDTNGFNATYSGVLRGEGGGLTKIGDGTLTISGAQTYFGDTFVLGGTLMLNGAVARDVIVGAPLEDQGPQPAKAPARSARQGGRSLTSLDADRALPVQYGRSIIAPSLGNNVTVAAAPADAPIFGGSGTVGGNLINNGGIVSPGNSPGALRINGNYSQSSDSTLRIEIAGTDSDDFDRLLVRGTATLDGAVQFITLDGFQPRGGARFVFLTAGGGVSGTFSSMELSTPLILGRVEYRSNSVALTFGRRPIKPIFNGGEDDVDDEDDVVVVDAPRDLPRLTGNQTAVARALDGAIDDPRLGTVFGELDRYSFHGIPGALDLIAPEELSAIYEVGIGTARVNAFNLDRHLGDLRAGRTGFSSERFRLDPIAEQGSAAGKTVLHPDGKTTGDGKTSVFEQRPDNRWSAFLSGSGEFLDINGDDNANGYEITTGGVTLGADYRVTENFAIGLLAGYAGTGSELFGDGHILVNSGKFGVYATLFTENWYVNGLAAGGYNSYDIKRRGLGGTTRGETEGGEFTGLLTTGYDVYSGPITWGPFVEAQYTYVGYDGFEESGSAAPLDIQSNDSESLRTRIGARVSYSADLGKVRLLPELRVAWQHEYLDRTRPTDSRFATGAGSVFRVEGPEMGRDSLIVNASISLLHSERFTTYLAYDGELGRQRYESHTVSGGVSVGF